MGTATSEFDELRNAIPSPFNGRLLHKRSLLKGRFIPGKREVLSATIEIEGGLVTDKLDARVDFVVTADRAAKNSIKNKVATLNAEGASILVIEADAFLKLVRATAPRVLGQPLAELDSLAMQATRIRFQWLTKEGAKTRAVAIDSRSLKYPWGVRYSGDRALLPTTGLRRFSTALQFLAVRLPTDSIRFETLEVSSSGSPKSGGELRKLVLRVIAEAFGQPVPPASKLTKATKAYRARLAERQNKVKVEGEKQKVQEKRKTERTIARQVGKVTDIATFLKALELRADGAKIAKATKMLKAEKFQLFNDITDDHLNGVVKSQSDSSLLYACRIESSGVYACCTQNLNICGGLRGSPCKHLLVLIIGLVKAGQLDPSTIDAWVAKAQHAKPELNKETMGEIFLRYKGAEAGEVDWRPTQTVPEDYYAL